MLKNEHVVELLPEFVLGVLDNEETDRVVKHLQECDSCRVDMAAYQNVADQLGLAAPDVEPPADLKQKVMGSILEKQKPIQRASQPGFWAFLSSFVLSWKMVALLVIVALGASNLFLWQQVNGLKASSKPVEFRTVAMVGTTADLKGTGLLVISPDGLYGTLVVQSLPPLDPNHQYQLWLNKDGTHTNGGIFSVSEDGYYSMMIWSPQPLGNYTSFGITIEPGGGSPGPTGKKVLGGNL